MPPTNVHRAYRSASVTTASPAEILIRLYDRLLLDMQRAAGHIEAREYEAANRVSQNAQDIVLALHDALDVEVWPAGARLAEIYAFLRVELVTANVTKDAGQLTRCLPIVAQLRETWSEARLAASSANASPAHASGPAGSNSYRS